MKLTKTRFDGVWLLEPQVFSDARGFFMESYNQRALKEKGISLDIVQDNHSLSRETGVLRGLHYQLEPAAQTKLVRVLAGEIFDVVVDIRRGSPTFGQWESFIITAENKLQLLVPRGFAHGFCTIKPNTEVLYKVDEYYSPAHDRGICWDDPALAINWPIANPRLSEKDQKHPPLAQAENNFQYCGGAGA